MEPRFTRFWRAGVSSFPGELRGPERRRPRTLEPDDAAGVWQPREMRGYELVAEPGAAAWHELHAKDYDAAVAFYQKVFGWETDVMSDTPEFRYTTLGAGDSAKAGIMDASGYLPAEVPSNWQIYFSVEDADASIEKAVSLGATLVDAPDDSSFGRLATLADPTGAMFKIVADNRPEGTGSQSPGA